MKKWLFLISFCIGSVAVFAQPTSFGGITPGQTTREELKGLVKNPSKIGVSDSAESLELKQPDGKFVEVKFHNGVVYEVAVRINTLPEMEPSVVTRLHMSPELRLALIEKYGQPRVKVGGTKMVTCRNKLGASFERLDGEEERRWPVKDGVQGALHLLAGYCHEYSLQSYVLRHVATVKTVELAAAKRMLKEEEDQKRKLGNAY